MNSNSTSRNKLSERYSTRLWQAGIIGSLKGTLFGIISGAFLNYRYNHGPNVGFFRTPRKVWWIVSWNMVGIIFQTNSAKAKIAKEIAVEEDIRINSYIQDQLIDSRSS